MKTTIIILSVVLIVVVVIVFAAAPTGHGVYNVLKDFQTMFGAVVGLFGLGLVAFWNAKLARARDDHLHNREQCALTNLIASEFSLIKQAVKRHREFYENSANTVRISHLKVLFDDPDLMPPYAAALSELKILPTEIVEKVFPVYSFPAKMKSAFSNLGYVFEQLTDDELSKKEIEVLLEVFQKLEKNIDDAQPLLRSYADTGELPA